MTRVGETIAGKYRVVASGRRTLRCENRVISAPTDELGAAELHERFGI